MGSKARRMVGERKTEKRVRREDGIFITGELRFIGGDGEDEYDRAEASEEGGERMNRVVFSSVSDEWETPDDIFRELDDEFHFTLDAAASSENAKIGKYYTREDNALLQDWGGETVYCQSALLPGNAGRVRTEVLRGIA